MIKPAKAGPASSRSRRMQQFARPLRDRRKIAGAMHDADAAAHAGRVVTNAQLLREVWGPAHAENGHYVRIYMGHLRQKLEDDPAQPRHLLTETAVGYRLQP